MRRARSAALLFLVLAMLAAAGCGSTSYYEWGRYEDSIYKVTIRPDGFDLQAEIDSLEQQLEKTAAKQRPVPPGLHAHVGFLHSIAGNLDAARGHFEEEKALYPESARFIDGLLARMGPRS